MTRPRFFDPPPVSPGDARRMAAATARNRDAILVQLRRLLPQSGVVLEVGSGTGEHVVHFAAVLQGLVFQPSDPDEGCRASIAAWAAHQGLPNVRPPLDLDVLRTPWPIERADAVVCSNMLHVAVAEATAALVLGAARVVRDGGPLILYGPFRVGGVHVSPSNVAFDERLRAHDPTWGVRDVDDLAAAAAPLGWGVKEVIEMPANNRIVVVGDPRPLST